MNTFQVALNLVTQDPITASYLEAGLYPVTSSWAENAISASYAPNGSVSVGIVPIGSITAWHKSFANTPSLPSEFVECNGQTLSDVESVYNGQTIPNLNAFSGSSQKFLRGSISSGNTGGSDSHSHTLNGLPYHNIDSSFGGSGAYDLTSNSNTTDSTSSLPPYFEIVWIMRIK